MVILTKYTGYQLEFTRYWPPLMYKHQECQFIVIDPFNKLWYPKDLKNLEVVNDWDDIKSWKGPMLECPINKLPTYKAMIVLQNKKSGNFTPDNLGAKFYKVTTSFRSSDG
tara:strand:- start:865 stop:1197 length:333 start_codon:yes stop_codon:yes gene_type:complete